MTVTMFPFFHSKEYPRSEHLFFSSHMHNSIRQTLFCVHAEFIGKLSSPTKARPLSSLVNAMSVKLQNTVFIQHYYLFVLGRSIWAYNCTDKHFWMFMPRTSEHYKPSLSFTSFKAAVIHELVAADFPQQCLIAVHAFWTPLCCCRVAAVALCGLMCSDICVPLSLSQHVQHDLLTVDSIATSNESSAEPDSPLPSRSIFQLQHMICGARCPTESCRCSEL